jgi:hypothetical protein
MAKTAGDKAIGGGLSAAAADAGKNAGEAVGRAVDRHAEKLSKEYNPKNDPRYDPRSLLGGGASGTDAQPTKSAKSGKDAARKK